MKRKLTLFTFVLTAFLLSGCASGNTPDAGNSSSSVQQISEAAAKEIALTHAGLTADQVTFIKSEIDTDDGRKQYEIEFVTKDHKEYDYEIDMYTGEILDYDYEAEHYPQSSETAPSETAPSVNGA